ncbi:uncharacterized protein [Nicotiana sylvestris]|uniref:uncharacterized protein n=1 Tax=Nicotiana sylvestris TaxID=4096 RepID=UPI00388CCA45
MGIVETNGVNFVVFQMIGSAKRWWNDFVLTRPVGLPALTWDHFSQLFLEMFLLITQTEDYRRRFKHLQQGSMTFTQYETRFADLARHALLYSPSRERVKRFIEGLAQPIILQMAKETGSEISFQDAANVARRVEEVLAQGSGTVSVCSRDASVLFDPRSTYSYVSSYFATYLVVPHDSLIAPVYVSILVGDYIVVDRVYRSCVVIIGGLETRVDLLLLDIVNFDIILGMDWLSPYHAILDCHAKIVTLALSGFPRLEWTGHSIGRFISNMKARCMVEKGCLAYLAYVRDSSAQVPSMNSIPVVCEFQEVFPVDLLGMPPDRDIDFCIDVAPDT